MASFNKVILMGNLTRDPELKYTPAGKSVCNFGLAVNRKWKNKDGSDAGDVLFIDVEAWEKTADVAGQFLAKGRPVHIEGWLKLDSWNDRDTGQKRTKIKVVCDHLQLLGEKPKDERGGEHEQYPPAYRPQQTAVPQSAFAPTAYDAGVDEVEFGEGVDNPF